MAILCLLCLFQVETPSLYVQVDGTRTEQPPVLLINGLGQELGLWDSLVDALKEDMLIVRFDFPGIGRSPLGQRPMTLEEMSSTCLQVIKSRELDKVHLVGISLGSFVAQDFASKHPEKIQSLVLMSSSMGSVNHVPPSMEVIQFLMGQSGLEGEEKTRKGLELSLHASFLENNPVEVNALMQHFKSLKRDPQVLFQQTMAGMAFDATLLKAFSGPTLVIHGLEDQVVPVENGRKLSDHLQCNRVLIPSAGHLCHIDATEAVVEALRPFFIESVRKQK